MGMPHGIRCIRWPTGVGLPEVIPVKKNAYRTVAVNLVDAQKLAEVFRGKKLVIAADAAKWDFVAALMAEDRSVALTIHWRAPNQTRLFVRLVAALAAIAQVEFAVESTGTYADPLRFLLAEIGVPIFRVSAKHSHDAAEVFDGVPSSHDAKSAAIIGWLHLQGRSQRWTSGGQKVFGRAGGKRGDLRGGETTPAPARCCGSGPRPANSYLRFFVLSPSPFGRRGRGLRGSAPSAPRNAR